MSQYSSSDETRSAHTEASSYSVKRYFLRTDEPRRWWPLGIIPLLLLGLLFLLGALAIAPDMQKSTEASVQSALHEAGYSQLNVKADGQRILVRGVAESKDAASIKRMAMGATCDSFVANELVCPTKVHVELEQPSASVNHDFSFVRTTKGLVLRGEVPGPEMHQQLIEEAEARYSSVIDSLHVGNDGENVPYDWAVQKSLTLLERVHTGKVDWADGVISLTARTVREEEESIRKMFSSMRYPDRMGMLEFLFEEDIDSCNQELEGALSETMIFFQTGSAVISDESQKLLMDLGGIAGECPGGLIVEGHTDNVGDDQSNLDLSQRRAQAVVNALAEHGVSESRLSAIGYGEARPVMSNETPQGRAMNRRIAIRVADFN